MTTPGKAVLVDVVAHAQHQRLVHARLDFKVPGRSRPAIGTRRPARALELHPVESFGVGRGAQHELPVGVHDEGIAVEHQFVLAAAQVHVDERHAAFAHARAHHALALALPVHLVGRGVDHQQHLRAQLARAARGLLSQMSSHTRSPSLMPRHSNTAGPVPGLK